MLLEELLQLQQSKLSFGGAQINPWHSLGGPILALWRITSGLACRLPAGWSSSRGYKAHGCCWRATDLSWTPKDSPVSSRVFQVPAMPPIGQPQANKVSGLHYRVNDCPKGFHLVFFHHIPESFYQLTLQVTDSRVWKHLVPKVSQHWMSSFKALTSKNSSLSSSAFLWFSGMLHIFLMFLAIVFITCFMNCWNIKLK